MDPAKAFKHNSSAQAPGSGALGAALTATGRVYDIPREPGQASPTDSSQADLSILYMLPLGEHNVLNVWEVGRQRVAWKLPAQRLTTVAASRLVLTLSFFMQLHLDDEISMRRCIMKAHDTCLIGQPQKLWPYRGRQGRD